MISSSVALRGCAAGWLDGINPKNKALGAATQSGHGFAIANGIREALSIIPGAARAAGYVPALAAAGAPFGF